MIVDEHIHLGGLFKDTDYFLKCLDESGIDFVLATPYMFEDENIPRVLMSKNIPPRLAGTKTAMKLASKVMHNKRFAKRYIEEPPNQYVADMIKCLPERIYGVYWVNPNIGGTDIIKEAERYILDYDFVAVKLHQVIYPCELNGTKLEVLNLANEYKIPAFIHFSSTEEVKSVLNHMEKKPDLKVIMAHMGFFEEMADELCDFPNMYFDISPLYAHDDDSIKYAIDKVGAERIVFGSDAPCPGFQKYAVERIKKLDIGEDDKNKILGDNIIGLMNERVLVNRQVKQA